MSAKLQVSVSGDLKKALGSRLKSVQDKLPAALAAGGNMIRNAWVENCKKNIFISTRR